MKKFYKILVEDFRANYKAGWITVIFVWNYRCGRALLLARRRFGVAVLPIYIVLRFSGRLLSLVIGCSFPFAASLGRRVSFQHGLHGIFVSSMATIGDDCTILHQVTIGSNIGAYKAAPAAPRIGNHVFIGAGAKIIGDITVGDGASVGASALVCVAVPPNARVRATAAQVLVQ